MEGAKRQDGSEPAVVLYTTPTCPYCRAAVGLLEDKGLSYEEIDVSRDPELRARVSRANGNWPTVPMIFVRGKFVGGYTDLAALERSGQLDAMVQGG